SLSWRLLHRSVMHPRPSGVLPSSGYPLTFLGINLHSWINEVLFPAGNSGIRLLFVVRWWFYSPNWSHKSGEIMSLSYFPGENGWETKPKPKNDANARIPTVT